MTAIINELINCLEQLQTTNYSNPVSARAHNVKAEAALSLIFDIGRENISLTSEQKQVIAGKLAAAVRPIQINIQNHYFEFSPKIKTILEKRSALQFLLDDYRRLPVPGDETLSNVFEKVVLKETIQILDEIIEKNRKESVSKKELIKRYREEFSSGSEDESDCNSNQGLPSSHSWWQ